ncbi:AAA family ATPase [Pseudomonas aeruginosa]
MDYSYLSGLVPMPGAPVDFQLCLEAIPDLHALATTPQDPVHHAEGDVWTHTKMVVEALVNGDAYREANADERFTLFMSALLHDISKPSTTEIEDIIDPVSGLPRQKISQPGHSAKGAIDARLILWRSGVPFDLRETICRIIAVHQVPFFAIKGDRSGKTPEFLAHRMSWEVPLWQLCAVATADIEGRIANDKQKVLDDIEVFRLLADELGCLREPAKFVDDYTRLRYFLGDNIPDSTIGINPLYREKVGSQVIVLSGPPASGKNTWIDKHAAGLPVVSYDDAREDLGLRHGKEGGVVGHHVYDMAKRFLQQKQDFVWNATHLSKQMRTMALDFIHGYHGDVRLVYLEAPEKVLYDRNSKRDSSLRNEDLRRMLFKWEVPMPWEAKAVEYNTGASEKTLKRSASRKHDENSRGM